MATVRTPQQMRAIFFRLSREMRRLNQQPAHPSYQLAVNRWRSGDDSSLVELMRGRKEYADVLRQARKQPIHSITNRLLDREVENLKHADMGDFMDAAKWNPIFEARSRLGGKLRVLHRAKTRRDPNNTERLLDRSSHGGITTPATYLQRRIGPKLSGHNQAPLRLPFEGNEPAYNKERADMILRTREPIQRIAPGYVRQTRMPGFRTATPGTHGVSGIPASRAGTTSGETRRRAGALSQSEYRNLLEAYQSQMKKWRRRGWNV